MSEYAVAMADVPHPEQRRTRAAIRALRRHDKPSDPGRHRRLGRGDFYPPGAAAAARLKALERIDPVA